MQAFFMFAAISFDGPGWRCLFACAWCCLWACWALPRRATGRGPLRLTHETKKVVLTSTQDLSPCVGFWLLNTMGLSSRDGTFLDFHACHAPLLPVGRDGPCASAHALGVSTLRVGHSCLGRPHSR